MRKCKEEWLILEQVTILVDKCQLRIVTLSTDKCLINNNLRITSGNKVKLMSMIQHLENHNEIVLISRMKKPGMFI